MPHMWQVIGRPDLLIFLDVSHPVAQIRRWLNWQPADLDEQHHRLRHARTHCNFYLNTDPLTPQQVCDQAMAFLISRTSSSGIMPRPNSPPGWNSCRTRVFV